MCKNRSGDEFNRRALEDVVDAYDLLIRVLHWERDRWLTLAVALTARDQEKATEILAQQAAYIREQASR